MSWLSFQEVGLPLNPSSNYQHGHLFSGTNTFLLGAGAIAQWLRLPATCPQDTSLVPSTYI